MSVESTVAAVNCAAVPDKGEQQTFAAAVLLVCRTVVMCSKTRNGVR